MRAALAGAAVALVAGLAGGALALGLQGDDGERPVVTTVVRSGTDAGIDPVALYAGAEHGVVTIESSFGEDKETSGSGFVADAERGLIVTASHVIADVGSGEQALAVRIVLGDGTRADAEVLGYDLFEDTAVLEVDPEKLGLR